MFLGLSAFGNEVFRSPTSAVRNITYGEIKNGIYDRLDIRENIDIPLTNEKEQWQIDYRVLFDFVNNSLEGGNLVTGSGLDVESFYIKRRKKDELKDIIVGSVPFNNLDNMTFTDYTQSNDEFVYTLVPVLENGLQGNGTSVQIKSDFVGWVLVDKDTNKFQNFDTFIDSEPTVGTQLNQGRTVIETLNKYAHIFYDNREYETFSLQTVLIGDEFKRVGKKYQEFLDAFIKPHKAVLVKSGDGRIYVCDVFAPQTSQPQNTWENREYMQISISLQEIQSYEDYMSS